MEISVRDFKAAGMEIGADWRSSAVQNGVMDGALGRPRSEYRHPKLKGWAETYDKAFAFGEKLARKR